MNVDLVREDIIVHPGSPLTLPLPDSLPELPDFEGILGSKNGPVERQGSTPDPEEIPPSVEELAANPPFTAFEGEK